MWILLPFKLTFWLLLLGGLFFAAYRNKENITYKFKEVYARMKRGLGSGISLNDSFADDLESGLSSRNFDIISQNEEDTRLGLDNVSKEEIKRIMEIDNVSFDKARLLYTERKFGKNGIAPDGTPMDPKAVTFSK